MVKRTTISKRLQEAPDTGAGTPIGSGDWRLVIEQLVGTGATWGTPTTWGAPTKWGSLTWSDITSSVRGVEWDRGADQPNGLPRIGEIRLDIANTSTTFDPWRNYSRCRPGTIMRAGLVSAADSRADGWLPLWCGVVDDWPITYIAPRSSGYRADSFARVTLYETASQLSTIERPQSFTAGAGDLVVDRINRLLTDAQWRFGLVEGFGVAGEPVYTLQATDMALNRTAEIYVTADSTGTVIRSDVTGACLLTTVDASATVSRLREFSASAGASCIALDAGPDGIDSGLINVAYDADSVISANNKEPIRNSHRWTRIGGTEQVFEHAVSMGRFGQATSARSDLLCQTDAEVLELAQAANDYTALTALRVENIDVTATRRPLALLAVAAADIHDLVSVSPPATSGFTGSGMGRLRRMTHRVTSMTPSSLSWIASYAVDFYAFNDITGAILDPAPR